MRRFARSRLTTGALLERVVLLLLLAFVCALMGWFFYMQSAGVGADGNGTSAAPLPGGAAPSGAGQRSRQ